MPQMPALLLSLVLASAYAAAFHLWLGRGLRDLPPFWLASVLGFAAGQIAGQMLDLIPVTIGQLQIIEATLGAFLFLFIAKWLRHGSRTQ
jgi:hypothetical protein